MAVPRLWLSAWHPTTAQNTRAGRRSDQMIGTCVPVLFLFSGAFDAVSRLEKLTWFHEPWTVPGGPQWMRDEASGLCTWGMCRS